VNTTKNDNKEEMDFSSSLLSSFDSSISSEEYRDKLFDSLANILKFKFPNEKPKQQIRAHDDRITIACPYCGDSLSNVYKKRGNIITTGKFAGYYKCFNCDAFKSVDNFLKDFNQDVDLNFINYLAENKGDFSTANYGNYDISILVDTDYIDKISIDRDLLKSKLGLIEIEGTTIKTWLNKRLQYDYHKFLFNQLENYLVILNLSPSGKVLGFQKRFMGFVKDGNKYNTYTLSKIYDILGIKDIEISDDINTLSQLYNITEINFNKLITLFEGPLDAFLYKNSIANAGAGKAFPLDLPIRYWYDDDDTGRKKAIEKIQNNGIVFLWERFKIDYDIPHRLKWDLNDLLIWFKNNNIKFPYYMLDSYFSNDPIDVLDI